jgi:hypothetical protein
MVSPHEVYCLGSGEESPAVSYPTPSFRLCSFANHVGNSVVGDIER